jgi:DNA polymerase III delta subunit
MTVQEVKNQIKTNKIKNFYIFTGQESRVIDIYTNKIAECKKLEIQHINSISDVYSKFFNKSLVTKNYCYVLRDDKELLLQEKLWQPLSVESVQGNNLVILVLTNVDKRSKFYNRFKNDIVEFEHLPENILMKYIKKELPLNDNSCLKLIDICESDYNRILLELDKINLYANITYIEVNGNGADYDRAFLDLVEQGVIYQPPKDAIFDFVDAVLKGKVKQSFELLGNCYGVGESNIVLLSVLYNNVKQVLQVQSCESNDIAKTTGLTGWQIRNAKDKCGYYSIGDLVYFLKFIRKVEKGIKTGEIDESISVEYVLVNMLEGF